MDGSDPSPRETPEVKEPFGSTPLQPSASGGWGRPLLTGCAVLVVLVGLALAIFAWKAGDVLRWGLARYEATILEKLPEDIAPADVARLRRAFAGLTDALENDRIDPNALQEMQRELVEVGRRVEDLTAEDVRRLAAALERAAGNAPPADASPPPVQPEAEPAPVAAAG